MRLQRLKLVNACQHANFEIMFDPRMSGIIGPNGCLGGEQQIYDPVAKTWRRVEDITAPWHVYAMDDETGKLVVGLADQPYVKGVADLYLVTLETGESFVSTLHHRVRDVSAYDSVASAGERQSLLPLYLPESISDIAPSACQLDAHHLSYIAAGSQDGYRHEHCLCDAPLLQEPSSDLASSPLPAGALGHIRDYLREDGQDIEQERNRSCQLFGHPSKRGFSHRRTDQRDASESPSDDILAQSCLPCTLAAYQSQLPTCVLPGTTGVAAPRSSELFSVQLAVPEYFVGAARRALAYYCSRLFWPLLLLIEYCKAKLDAYGRGRSSVSSLTGGQCTRITSITFLRRDRFFDFTVHHYHNYWMAGIVHHNSGKTNCASMAYAALTGDYSRNAGVKAANVRQLAKKNDPAYIELDLTHGDVEYKIVRGLQNTATSLHLRWPGGEELIEGDEKVNNRMKAALGNKQLLDLYVFPAQTQLTSWIEATPAQRSDFFERLFKLEQARQCFKLAGEHVNKIVVEDVSEKLTEAREALKAQTAQFNELNAAYQEVEKYLKYDPDEDPLTTIVRQYEQRKTLSARIRTLKEALEDAEFAAGKAAAREKAAAEKLAKASTELVSLKKAANKARATLLSLDAVKAITGNYKTLCHRVASLQEARDALKPPRPVKAPTGDKPDALKARRQGIATTIQRDTEVKQGIRTGVCPTCGAKAAAGAEAEAKRLEAKIKADKATLKQLDAAIEEAEEAQEAYDAYRKAQDLYEKEIQRVTNELSVADDALADAKSQLDGIEQVSEDPVELRETVNRYEDASRIVEDLAEASSQAKIDTAKVTAGVEHLEKDLEKLRTELATIAVTREDSEAAQEQLAAKRVQRDKAIRLDKELTAVEALSEAKAAEIAKLKKQQAAGLKMLQWQGFVTEMRDVLRDLPKVVSFQYLELLAYECNQELELFDLDFTVTPTEDLSFIAHFADGRTQPMQRLSWGQKVALAISFLMSVNSLFAADIGMLWLDEPTEYLDAHRIAALRKVLERMREKAGESGLQIVMITHVTQFIDLFDYVVITDAQEVGV